MKTTMWIRLVLLTAVSLHLSACGKSKGDGVQVKAAPKAGSTQTPGKDTSDKSAESQDVPAPTETEGRPVANAPKVIKDIENKDQKKADDGKQVVEEKTEKKQEDKKQTVVTKQDEKKETEKKTEKVEEKAQEQAVSNSGDDRFTGSANDYLRTFLKAQEAELSQSQRNENKKAAESILSTNLKIDYNATGDVMLTLVVGNSKNKRTVVLGGLMSQNRTSKLRRANESIQADLKCMDVTNAGLKSCETALVKVKMSASANVNIIFRRTNMNVSANFGQKQCMTQACEDIYSLFKQTEDGVHDWKNIVLAKLESAEVIGGRSTFRGIIRTRANEAIVIGGALLKNEMNQVADRNFKLEELVDFRNVSLRDNMNRSLSEVRIIGNDGIGGIRLRVDMKILENGSRDSFEINFQRISRDLMPLTATLN